MNDIVNKTRPNWTDYFVKIANVTKERSPCHRLKVGCVLVKNNRIISQGYNGFLPGCPHNSIIRNNHEQATVHAEQNAISDCAKRGVNCCDSIAYITHYPCLNCCKILLASGIKKIIYINDYKNDVIVSKLCYQLNVPIQKYGDNNSPEYNENILENKNTITNTITNF